MFTPREISDRLEIQHRIDLYCHALDEGRLDELDEVFLPDARLDFSCLGLEPMTWLQMKERLRTGPTVPYEQHLYTNVHVTFSDQDTAFTRSKVYNPQGLPGAGGKIHFFGNHGIYYDEWARTPTGWRIRDRRWDHKFYSGDYPFDRPMPRSGMFELIDQSEAGRQ
jgi:hypothetical protein